jgi:hypothetical protein
VNTLVSLPIAAAVPVASPSIAAPSVPVADSSGVGSLKRAEQVVDLLRTRYREGWKINEQAAGGALAYCRRYAEDGSDPDDEREAAIEFFHSHGISTDWVFGGDIAGLICGVTKYSKRANGLADAELLSLADQYLDAQQRYRALQNRVDEMEEQFRRRGPQPDALSWSKGDTELGLPMPYAYPKDRQPNWDRPVDVEQLRRKRWMFAEVL